MDRHEPSCTVPRQGLARPWRNQPYARKVSTSRISTEMSFPDGAW